MEAAAHRVCVCVKNKSKLVLVYTAVHISLPGDAYFYSLPCDGLDFREVSYQVDYSSTLF